MIALVNLTAAYSRQLHQAAVTRAFELDGAMSTLVIEDTIGGNPQGLNVTWAMHTRAYITTGPQAVALLRAPGSGKLSVRFEATPGDACGTWQSAEVVLPQSPPRFPLWGARKLWLACAPSLSRLRVTLSHTD